MRNYKNEYKNKLRTADEAVQAVKSGDYVSYGHFAMSPIGLDEALSKRAGELSDVKIKAVMALFVTKTFWPIRRKNLSRTIAVITAPLRGNWRKKAYATMFPIITASRRLLHEENCLSHPMYSCS
jgi:Acetyl-CoA hydrolase